MSGSGDSNRAVMIAVVVLGFFLIGLVAMLLTGVLAGGNPR